MRRLRIAGGTVNQIPLDWNNNLENIKSCIEAARNDNADILVLPELCISGYGCEDLFLSEWVSKKSIIKLQSLLPFTRGIGVVLGLPIRIKGRTYNASCFINDGQIKGFYLKQNLANDGIYYEQRWFKPGKPGDVGVFSIDGKEFPAGEIVVDFKGVKTGFEICEDIWVDQRPACRFHKQGVQLILNCSASHFSFGKSPERQALVLNSSEKFECAYVYANLLGNESGQIIFDGDIIFAQNGKLLSKGPTFGFDNYRVILCDVEFDTPEQNGIQKIIYPKNEEFLHAESLALLDYLRKSKSKGFVISLSGGADSAICACLVYLSIKTGVAALGVNSFLKKVGREDLSNILEKTPKDEQVKGIVKEMLILAYQATENSSPHTLRAATALAEELGGTFLNWNVDNVIEAYTSIIEGKLGFKFAWKEHDIILQNIQARSRSPIIWILANLKNYLLLVTSNRSEGSVGYTTMDGDTSGSLAPIAGVSKVFIKDWLTWASEELELTSLKVINEMKPTAELRPLDKNQTDEDDLMPYGLLQEIEELAVRRKLSPVEVYYRLKESSNENESLLSGYIIKFFRMLGRSQWKRQRFAPTFHLDDYNINPASWFRFPVLSSSFNDEIRELEEIIGKSQ